MSILPQLAKHPASGLTERLAREVAADLTLAVRDSLHLMRAARRGSRARRMARRLAQAQFSQLNHFHP